MKDSVIDVNLDSPEKRKLGEEAWGDHSEALVKEWGDAASKASEAHAAAGKVFKDKHVRYGLPAVLIPIIMAPLSTTLADEDGIEYVNMIGFLASGCFSAIHTFFSFDKKHQQHMDYSARYGDVCSDIKYELVKARRFRISSDQFLMKIQMKMDSLGGSAPDL